MRASSNMLISVFAAQKKQEQLFAAEKKSIAQNSQLRKMSHAYKFVFFNCFSVLFKSISFEAFDSF